LERESGVLSRTGEYALRAVLLLTQRNGARALPASEIARVLGVPRNYLSKTLQRLVKRGVLTSVRGPTGGFALARDPASLPISAVVSEFEETEPLGTCVLGDAGCDAKHPCAAHARWKKWSDEMAQLLDGTMVGELVGGGEGEVGGRGRGLERKYARG
jgi:Rrf2 family protein